MKTRKRKSNPRAKKRNKRKVATSHRPAPLPIVIFTDAGDPDPQDAKIVDQQAVQFHNQAGLDSYIEFSGDKALFKKDGSNAGYQDLPVGGDGEILTGKRNGKDRKVYYDVFMGQENRRAAKGNGTIKVGQTL